MKAFGLTIGISLALCASASLAKDERDDPKIARGKQVYEYNCIACHGLGPGFPPFPELAGTGALRMKYAGTNIPAILTERTDLTPELVEVFVRNGISVMPFYRKTEIDDADLSALGAYLSRNNPSLSKK
jgi:mono/diheme cytochrome c family protein